MLEPVNHRAEDLFHPSVNVPHDSDFSILKATEKFRIFLAGVNALDAVAKNNKIAVNSSLIRGNARAGTVNTSAFADFDFLLRADG